MSSPFRKCFSPRKSSTPDDDFDLVGVVNDLQNKLNAGGQTLDIPLPQIVVVGCQSAGKTTLLESIVGREFLPRGTGVVTRRPTIIQLYPCKDEYAVFMHKGDEVFTDFRNVMNEITHETQREPGPVGFSSKPIILKIFSPNVLKLTLVDLPGLIRVTVGDQSEDSIAEVRNMVLEEIKKPNSLILAVTPANQDIANSDALEIAKTVDPKRIRTIGVLTKLDLMDDGTDARDILQNKVVSLCKGHVGVRNRSQKDVEEGRDIKYCIEKEKEYFASKPCYRDIAHKMGIPYLQKLLHQELRKHIKEFLPVVRKELLQTLSSFRKELKDFESFIGNDTTKTNGVQCYLYRLVQDFIEEFRIQIVGYSEKVNMKKLSAGAVIKYNLYNDIQNLKMPAILGERELLIIIENIHGIRNSFSMPSLAVEAVNNHLVTQYIEPLDKSVDHIVDTLHEYVTESSEMLEHYPVLRNELLYMIRKSIDEASLKTKEMLERHVRAEMSFVNIHDENFEFPECKMADTIHPRKLQEFELHSNEADIESVLSSTSCVEAAETTFDNIKADSNLIVDTIASNPYTQKFAALLSEVTKRNLKIVQNHIIDFALKYITFHLVGTVLDFIKSSLIPSIWNSENIESVIEECKSDFLKIEELKSTCATLEDALNAIQNF